MSVLSGRISAVSPTLNWEQEIAHAEIEIDPSYKYTDIV